MKGYLHHPLVFNIFIKDMYEEVTGNYTKFAYTTELCVAYWEKCLQTTMVSEDVKRVLHWCNTWMMKLNLSKTEGTAFHTKDTCDRLGKEGLSMEKNYGIICVFKY